jgi:hypothetical protein
MTAPASPAVDTPVEPGPADGWWEEDPAEAARWDRRHFDRDED